MMTMCNQCRGKGVQFSKKCGTCGTTGNIRGEQKINITIPKGIRDGRNLILGGMGHGIQGGRNGDVICVVNILDHIDYYRDGMNLLRDIDIPVIDMILGTEIEFETLDGTVKVPIPKNCQTDKMFRLKHKGMVEEDGLRGDLLITVKPLIPKKLTDEELEILQNLKNKENLKVIT
jgi:molecular chaperone DnaJ